MSAVGALLLALCTVTFLADSKGTLGVRVLTVALLLLCFLTEARFLLIAIFAAMPFQQSILGSTGVANVSAVDVLTVAALSLLMIAASRSELRGGAALVGLSFFMVVSVFSSLSTLESKSTLVSLGRNFTVSLIPLLLFASAVQTSLRATIKLFEQAMFAYVVGCLLLSGFVLWTFVTKGATSAMYTLAINKNSLGPTLGLAVTICFASLLTTGSHMRRWQMTLGCASVVCGIGLLLSFSRGAWVSTGASLVVLLFLSGRFWIAIPASIVGGIAVLLVWAYVPEKVADYATSVSGKSETIRLRLLSIEDTLELWAQKPFLGHGVGLRKYIAPHNLIAEMLGEVGVVGLTLFGFAVVGAVLALRNARQALHLYPRMQFLFLAATGAFSVTLLHGMMDSYWRRGVACAGWAAIGMIVALSYSLHEKMDRVHARSFYR